MNKIIFLDLDGTIRDFDGTIPVSAKEAIARARSKGHQVCICSGRAHFQLAPLLQGMEFDGYITGSGSYVIYQGECLRHKFITQFTYLSLCSYLMEYNCAFELMTYQRSYLLRQSLPNFEQIVGNIQKSLGSNAAKLVEERPTLIDSPLDVHEIEKILFFSDSFTLEELKDHWGTCFYIVPSSLPASGKIAGEITPSVVNKAAGIQSILTKEEIDKKDVIAVGDSDNDIEMLQLAGCGIAMGNGNEAVKAAADYVTKPLREDGLYHAFVHMGLI